MSTKSILAFCFDLINFYCYIENKSFEWKDILSFLWEYWYSQGNIANFVKKIYLYVCQKIEIFLKVYAMICKAN